MPERRPNTPRLEPPQAPGSPHMKPIEVSASVAPESLQDSKPTSQGQSDGIEEAFLSPRAVMDLCINLILPELAPQTSDARDLKDVLDEPSSCRRLLVVLRVTQKGVHDGRFQAGHILAFPAIVLARTGKTSPADLIGERAGAFNLTKSHCKPCLLLSDTSGSRDAFQILEGAGLKGEVVRDVRLDELNTETVGPTASTSDAALHLLRTDAKVSQSPRNFQVAFSLVDEGPSADGVSPFLLDIDQDDNIVILLTRVYFTPHSTEDSNLLEAT
mmetsp:Transcript_27482/g.89530  ORF Transcript_27482/g.89530 Transcript_27482/m.89530 type:complete len:272 (+) Transcript_27482:2440-3255(+)